MKKYLNTCKIITHENKYRPNRGDLHSCWHTSYYCAGEIAETGQTDAHVPHETHFAGSITHLPSAPTLIAIIGHAAMQE